MARGTPRPWLWEGAFNACGRVYPAHPDPIPGRGLEKLLGQQLGVTPIWLVTVAKVTSL